MTGSDEECMQLYQAGDIAGFNEIYRRYAGRVYGYLLQRIKSVDQADDLLQAVFLKFHTARAQYLPKYPVSAWIFTIARTVLIDFVRTPAYRVHTVSFESGVHDPVFNDSQKEQEKVLDLTQLDPSQREVVRLRVEENLPFDEIARRLNIGSATARQRFSRALKKLKSVFEGGAS
jgi:RNA polymerase sigma-70 factor (ECF subfamily)